MTIGPRELAHREHANAIIARKGALKEYGKNSETFKLAEVRLTAAIANLPEPPPEWD
jgi:hypothetical protein